MRIDGLPPDFIGRISKITIGIVHSQNKCTSNWVAVGIWDGPDMAYRQQMRDSDSFSRDEPFPII